MGDRGWYGLMDDKLKDSREIKGRLKLVKRGRMNRDDGKRKVLDKAVCSDLKFLKEANEVPNHPW